MVKEQNKTVELSGTQQISRKEALLKAGKYAAFTAAAMLSILDPLVAQPPKSPPKPPRSASQQKKAKKDIPPPTY
jgi:hypothetical protein